TGALVDTARVTDASLKGGVFRYELVEMVDPYGNKIVYKYVKAKAFPVLDEIDYALQAGGVPRFYVKFSYEARQDVLSDCKPGFNLLLDQRLTEVAIFAGSEKIRRYALAYEDYTLAGGFSRLASVKQYGRGDVLHPIQFKFGYSKALGGTCTTNCEKPFLVDM